MSMCRVFSCVVGRGCFLRKALSIPGLSQDFSALRDRKLLYVLGSLPRDALSLNSVIRDENRKSRNTRSTGKFGLGVQNEAGQRLRVLPREHTGHSKHPLPTTQEKTLHMDITRWSTPKSDWLYSLQPKMEKFYTVSKNQDQGLTVAQTMNSLLQNSDLNWRN